MSPFRYRDEDESSSTGTILGVLAGAIAGFAAGMYVSQRMGGMSGIRSKLSQRASSMEATLRRRYESQHAVPEDFDEYDDDELETEGYDESLEERVLEAFRNDPMLSERAVDIGSISDGVIELAGWVEDEDEAQHAVTIARGVPGVNTVVNRIALGDEERRFEEAAQRARSGSTGGGQWEGGQVGTGRRRQGTSDEPDRHSGPKVPLEERWLRADDALRNSADDTEALAERRQRAKKAVRGDRTGGAPVAPTGVPKADHVANPTDVDTPI